MKEGKARIGDDDHPVELHHPGGDPNSEVQEMTRTGHRGAGNYSKNHPDGNKKPSRIDRNEAGRQRREHWKKKASEFYKVQEKDLPE
jgi:hypothetical protein